MIIKSLELENIRSYTNETVSFQEGINFLSGDIGSGKSSILQAIEFAFFGFKRGDLEGFQLLRKGELKGSVKLTLEDGNDEIQIFRSLKKSKTTENISQDNGYIKNNDNLEELSPQELNLAIFKILNFPESFIRKDKNLVYRFTIYTPQEQLKEILFSDNDTRLELIRKIFGIDKYKQLINAISVYMGKIREDKKVLSTKLEPQLKLESELKEINQELKLVESNLKQNQEKKKDLNEKKVKYSKMLDDREILENKVKDKIVILEKNLSTLDQIKNQIKELELELKNKKEELSNLSETKLKDEIKKLKDKEKNFDDKINKLNKEKLDSEKELSKFDKLKEEESQLTEKLNQLKNKKDVLKSKKESFDLTLTKCRVHDTQNKIKKIDIQLRSFEKKEKEFIKSKEEKLKIDLELNNLYNSENLDHLDSCPTCLQDISKDHKKKILREITVNKKKLTIELNELNKKIQDFDENEYKKLNEEKIILNEKLDSLKIQEKEETELKEEIRKRELEFKDIKELEDNLKDFKLKLEKETSLRNKVNDINKDILDLNKDHSKIKLEISNLENKLKSTDNIKEELKLKEEKIKKNKTVLEKEETFISQLDKLKSTLSKINKEEVKLEEVLDKINSKERDLISLISSDKTKKETSENRINNIKRDLDEINNIKRDLDKLLQNENFLSTEVINISTLIERILFTKFYIEFTEEFEFIFKELIEDNSFDVRLDEEFSPIIEQNGYDVGIKNLSGGEKSSLAIAYRLGLKKIIENNFADNKLSILILDEPTDGFSSEQVDRLGYLLKESDLKQIILVSHDEKIESISDSILHIEKQNHQSKVI